MRIDHPLPSQLPRLRSLWQEAFGDPEEFLDSFYRIAFSAERCLCVTVEDTVAAAAYWFDCSWEGRLCAYIYAVATGESFRGRGFCRALMEKLHSLLKTRGYEGAVLVPGDGWLFSMYASMGYRKMPGIRRETCRSGVVPARLQPLTGEEYALARKKYLPAGSVLQEGVDLEFLKEFYRFYRGDGFVLCAGKEGTRLHGAELLGQGEPDAILCALDCREGTFRSPAGDEDFAMYLPLQPDFAPQYFAFAFD